jgi:uncharacterized protein (TIGR03437 family)
MKSALKLYAIILLLAGPVLAGTLSVSPNNLQENGTAGDPNPTTDDVTLSNNGAGTVAYTVSGGNGFTNFSPSSGNLAGNASVNIHLSFFSTNLNPGTYNTFVIFNPGNVKLAIQFVVTGTTINVSTGTVSFMQPPGQRNTSNFTVVGVGGNTGVVVSKQSGDSWLSFSPGSGNTPATFSVSADSTNLLPGNYSGSLVVSCNPATCVPQPVSVSLTVVATTPLYSLTPTSASFNANAGTTTAQQKVVTLQNGGIAATFNAVPTSIGGWLSVTPSSGMIASGGSVALTVSADPTKLEAFAYPGSVTISGGGQSVTLGVTFSIQGIQVTASPGQLSFSALAGQKAATQTFQVNQVNGPGGTVNAAVGAGTPWLSVSPASGTVPATFTVTADGTSLAPGPHTGNVAVTCPAFCVQKNITINFTVNSTVKLTVDQTAVNLAANGGSTLLQTAQANVSNAGPIMTFTAMASSTGNWLSVSPPSATLNTGTSATLNIVANPAGLPPGVGNTAAVYTGGIAIFVPGVAAAVATITVTLKVSALGVVSSADYASPLSPGTIAAAFASGITDVVQSTSTTVLPPVIAGVSVNVVDSAGKQFQSGLFFVSPNQVNFEVPESAALGTATLTIKNPSGVVASATTPIVAVGPALYTANTQGFGPPAAFVCYSADCSVNSLLAQCDLSLNCSPVPIDMSKSSVVYLQLYGTGIRNRSDISKVSCNIGGTVLSVAYAGAQGAFPGLDQVNVILPGSLAGKGSVTLVLTADGVAAKPVTLNFK